MYTYDEVLESCVSAKDGQQISYEGIAKQCSYSTNTIRTTMVGEVVRPDVLREIASVLLPYNVEPTISFKKVK